MRIYLLSSNGKPFTTPTPARSLKHACQVQPVLAEGRGLEPQSRRTALFSKQARRPGRFAFQNLWINHRNKSSSLFLYWIYNLVASQHTQKSGYCFRP